MVWQNKINLSSNERIKCDAMKTKGHMGQTEITPFTILDESEAVVGSGSYTEHTNIRGLRTDCHLEYSLRGKKFTENW